MQEKQCGLLSKGNLFGDKQLWDTFHYNKCDQECAMMQIMCHQLEAHFCLVPEIWLQMEWQHAGSLPLHRSYTPKRHVRTLGRRIRIDVNNDKRLTELWVRFAGKESYRRVYDINKCTSQTRQYRDSEDKKRPSSLPWLLVITAVFSKSGCEDVALLCSGTKEINVFKRVPIRP